MITVTNRKSHVTKFYEILKAVRETPCYKQIHYRTRAKCFKYLQRNILNSELCKLSEF